MTRQVLIVTILILTVANIMLIRRLIVCQESLTFTDNEIADAIYSAEGGTTTRFPYGIVSIDTHGDVKYARAICLRTIRHARIRWLKAKCPGHFINYLGDRYAPKQPEWVKNVKWFLKDNRRTK